MSGQSPFQPPESVVAPAFGELLSRMRRARINAGGAASSRSEMSMMNEDERKVFAYGIEERKRVVESTLTLVFGQWAVHRFAIRRINMRPVRLLYTAACVVGTVSYVRSRATKVSTEMFAKILSLPTSSPMANEARVILAEMEGPDGEYFRRVCREKGFVEDLYAIVAALDAQEGKDIQDQNLHPQLRLRPRLLVDPPAHPSVQSRDQWQKDGVYRRSDAPFPSKEKLPASVGVQRSRGRDGDVMVVRRSSSRQSGERTTPEKEQFPPTPDNEFDVDKRNSSYDDDIFRESPQLNTRKGRDWGYGPDRAQSSSTPPEMSALEPDPYPYQPEPSRPFDFAGAAMQSRDEYRQSEDDTGDDIYDADPELDRTAALTPSQRRAAERRERRRMARERARDHPNASF